MIDNHILRLVLKPDGNFAVSHGTRIRFGVVWGLMVATAILKN
ncbi:MAG TPA: hypothetical protein V6D25_10395 [Leptolyngbyaceae cyanobacterium]